MKILHCIHSLNPSIGGPLEFVRQTSLVLAHRGHTVEVISLDAPNDPWPKGFPVAAYAFGRGQGGYGFAPQFVPWLQAHHPEYHAVVVHGIWQYNSFGVWRALHKTTTPYFVFPHGMLDPWFKRTYPLKHLKKLCYWPWAEYRVLRDAAAVLFTTEQERLLARESFPLYRCRELVVNFGTAAPEVDGQRVCEEFCHAFPRLRGESFLLFLGRLHEKKGCEELIRALATTPTARLVMAGPCADESYLAMLRRLTSQLGCADRVTFTGMLTGNLKWGALAAAEVFILPSHQENFGIAVVEALACGVPVLISNQVNIWREILADGCGYAEDDNLIGTRRLLERWRDTSSAQRAAMSAAARRSFAQRFEINHAVDSFLQVLENPLRAV
jgi:glycosyltransferase involved in cell wall biosynthesis